MKFVDTVTFAVFSDMRLGLRRSVGTRLLKYEATDILMYMSAPGSSKGRGGWPRRREACRRHLLCGHVLYSSVDSLCRVSLSTGSDSPPFQQGERFAETSERVTRREGFPPPHFGFGPRAPLVPATSLRAG